MRAGGMREDCSFWHRYWRDSAQTAGKTDPKLSPSNNQLTSGNRKWGAEEGDAVVVAGGQTIDSENNLSANGLFKARWAVWDASLFAQAEPLVQSQRELSDVAILK